MISKSIRPCIVMIAALVYATTAFGQDNRGTHEKGRVRTRRLQAL